MAISINKQKGGGFNGKSPLVTVMPENLTVPIHIKSLSSMLKICINHVNYSKMLCWEKTRRKKNDGRCLQMNTCDQSSSGGRLSKTRRRQVRVAKAALGSDRPNLSPNINKHIFSIFLLRMHASLFSPFHAVACRCHGELAKSLPLRVAANIFIFLQKQQISTHSMAQTIGRNTAMKGGQK